MKNKKVLYFLLPATILVWIMIFIRIYNTIYPGSEISNIPVNQIQHELPENQVSDTFLLNNNYRDPFLENHSRTVAVSIGTSSKTSAFNTTERHVTQKNKISWPNIQYTGMIKNKKSNKQLALLTINGNSSVMKVGEINKQIELCKIYNDSVEVRFEKEKRFIKK